MKRKSPPSPEAETELQNAMRKFCEDMERGKAAAPKGVLAALEREPREA